MSFLWGMGADEPLRYRLLPVSEFCNIGEPSPLLRCSDECAQTLSLQSVVCAGVCEERNSSGLPLQPVVIHAGWLGSQDKVRQLLFWEALPQHLEQAFCMMRLKPLCCRLETIRAWVFGILRNSSLEIELLHTEGVCNCTSFCTSAVGQHYACLPAPL